MNTIWNAAVGLAAIPLTAVAHEKGAAAAPPVFEKPKVEQVERITWQRPTTESFDNQKILVSRPASPLAGYEEKRFQSLVVKLALGTITPAEKQEFDAFQTRRIKTQEPLRSVAIEKRERVLRLMENLLTELNSFKRETGKGRG